MPLDHAPGPVRWELRSRPGGGTREVVHLDRRDATAYRRLVLPLAGRVERARTPGSFANRTDRSGRFEPVPVARRRWRRALEDALAARPLGAIAVSDVRECYGSIDRRALRRAGIDEHGLLAFLGRLEHVGVRGLPVGPSPSAILAEGVLGIADRAVTAATGVVPIRWVDDVVFVGEERSAAVRALDAWCRALRSLGLDPNDDKTVLRTCTEASATSIGRSTSLGGARSRAIIAPP
jgi:hypothetical protein